MNSAKPHGNTFYFYAQKNDKKHSKTLVYIYFSVVSEFTGVFSKKRGIPGRPVTVTKQDGWDLRTLVPGRDRDF